jgi:hypothetical protein
LKLDLAIILNDYPSVNRLSRDMGACSFTIHSPEIKPSILIYCPVTEGTIRNNGSGLPSEKSLRDTELGKETMNEFTDRN